MVIMYADNVTGSMQRTIEETERRRTVQREYNQEHGIEPQTIISAVKDTIHQYLKEAGYVSGEKDQETLRAAEMQSFYGSVKELDKEIVKLEKKMHEAARELRL